MSDKHEAFVRDLDNVLASLRLMLIEKNKKYGDSALHPLRLMSRASAIEQLKVRIDDKLSRLMHGDGSENEDVIQDLTGYFIIYRMAEHRQMRQDYVADDSDRR